MMQERISGMNEKNADVYRITCICVCLRKRTTIMPINGMNIIRLRIGISIESSFYILLEYIQHYGQGYN
jgi:hypothetical protein